MRAPWAPGRALMGSGLAALLVANADANSIYGGVAARKIKSGITWTRAMDSPV